MPKTATKTKYPNPMSQIFYDSLMVKLKADKQIIENKMWEIFSRMTDENLTHQEHQDLSEEHYQLRKIKRRIQKEMTDLAMHKISGKVVS